MLAVKTLKASLKDYCEKTDLVGMGYISNQNIHLSERIFWLVCLILATGGSYNLIREYQRTFESNAIGFSIEDTGIQDKTNFVSIGLCNSKNLVNHPVLVEYVKSFSKNGEQYEILYFLNNIIHLRSNVNGFLTVLCDQLASCPDCAQCPQTGYQEIARLVQMECPEVLVNCSWNGIEFDCCDYFLPLSTPMGRCLVLNSLHATKKNGPNWFKTEVGWDAGDGEMILHLNDPVSLHLLNEEEVPSETFLHNIYSIHDSNYNEFQLYVQDMINDPAIRQISPKYRKCKFPDENPQDSAYDFYSFSTCVVDCTKRFQFEKCGCNIFHLLVKSDDTIPSCDYEGLKCLDRNNLIILPPEALKPWNTDGPNCECFSSCNEKENNVFSGYSVDQKESNVSAKFQVTIKQKKSPEMFRRQAIRTQLNVVVTLGGILGLFMGASIISVVEILYFICIRVFYSSK